MKIVAKSSSPLIHLGEFPRASEILLRRHWRGDLTEEETLHATALIVNLHRRKAWLECNCVKDSAGEGPILVFYHRQDGFYGIRRMTGRINHAAGCDFHWEQQDRHKTEGQPNFILYQPPFIHSPNDPKVVSIKSAKAATHKAQPPLRSLFLWLLHRAGLNQLDGSSVLSDHRIKMLTEAAKSVLLPGSVLTLNDVLWTMPDAYLKRWAISDLYKFKDRGRWPEATPLQGYLVLPVKGIEGNVLISSGDRRIEITGRLDHEGEIDCFPRMAMISISEAGSRISALQAYTIPVRFLGHAHKDDGPVRHYFDLMPVFSNREREVADELAKVTRWHHEKGPSGNGVRVRRPVLRNDEAHGSTFLVEASEGKAFILLPENESDIARLQLDADRKRWMERLQKHDRVFTLMQDEPAEKVRSQVLGWLKGEMHYE